MSHEQLCSDDAIRQALARIDLRNTALDWNWKFHVSQLGYAGWFIHATFQRPDTNTGEMGEGRSREEFVRWAADPDTAIKTAYVILKLTVEHELMEAFRVDGVRVFDPHRTIAELGGVS